MAKLSDAVAGPLHAPREWQTARPVELFRRGVPISMTEDLERVLALPRRKPLDLEDPVACEAMVEHEMRKYSLGPRECKCAEIDRNIAEGKRECLKRLLPVQAWILHEANLYGGIISQCSVGSGKTLCNALVALALRDCQTILLLVPPTLLEQLIHDYRLIKEHFRVPSLFVHSNDPKTDWQCVVPSAPTLHVLAYSRLSRPDASDWIEKLAPDAVVCDEVDSVRDLLSSRTTRLLRFYGGSAQMNSVERAARARVKFCGWTGSLTDKALKEFFHLAALALKEGSPLPLDPIVAEEWGTCIDAVESPAPPGELLRLCDPVNYPDEDVRAAFRRRLAETPGFIVAQAKANLITGGDGSEILMDIREREAPPLPPIVEEALKKVRSGVRPDTLVGSQDDEELVDALSMAKCAHEVACGVMYRWRFPRKEPPDLIKRWYAARKSWHCELRDKLKDGEQYLDSPKLCEVAAERAHGDRQKDPTRPEWLARHWPDWRDIRAQVEPLPEARRLSDYLARDAAEWACENRGIVWYGMVEFAKMVGEISGLTIHTGGPNAGLLLRQETGERSIIASIKSHGRGRDGLQHLFHKQLIANVPASATSWEQIIGRIDRRGQRQGTIITEVYLHVEELRKSFEQAIRRSHYVQEVLGGSQKLVRGWSGSYLGRAL